MFYSLTKKTQRYKIRVFMLMTEDDFTMYLSLATALCSPFRRDVVQSVV